LIVAKKSTLNTTPGHSKILIICYAFPPNPGIGGRRWAKFAKYLDRQGEDIQVLTSTFSGKNKSNWLKDVEVLEKKGKITQVPTNFPRVLTTSPSSFFQKVGYRVALLYMKAKVKGNYFDPSNLWPTHLIPEVEKRIAEGYTTIIATGAPFTYIKDLIPVKKRYPQIQIIADFRDPWTNNKIGYGYTSLSEKRMNREKRYEKDILESYDMLVSVYQEHIQYMKSVVGDANYVHVPNAYDPDDFPEKKAISREDEKIRWVFAGNIYQHSAYIFDEFIKELLHLKKTNRALFDRFDFHFYGSIHPSFKRHFDQKELSNTIRFFGRISLDQVYHELAKADLTFMFLTDQMNYTKNTKFYEYIAMQKKIAVFSSEGFLAKYVRENKIGYSFTPGTLQEGFVEVERDFEMGNMEVPGNYNVVKNSVKHTLNHLLGEIHKLNTRPHKKG
jgi:glycosyltransferase involved in cell wall biosynthesis